MFCFRSIFGNVCDAELQIILHKRRHIGVGIAIGIRQKGGHKGQRVVIRQRVVISYIPMGTLVPSLLLNLTFLQCFGHFCPENWGYLHI